jgi:hypothetical protein
VRNEEGIEVFRNRRESQYRTQREKETLKNEYVRRLRLIMNAELSAKYN